MKTAGQSVKVSIHRKPIRFPGGLNANSSAPSMKTQRNIARYLAVRDVTLFMACIVGSGRGSHLGAFCSTDPARSQGPGPCVRRGSRCPCPAAPAPLPRPRCPARLSYMQMCGEDFSLLSLQTQTPRATDPAASQVPHPHPHMPPACPCHASSARPLIPLPASCALLSVAISPGACLSKTGVSCWLA